MTCRTNLDSVCTTKRIQKASTIINILYVFWLMFTFIDEPSEKLPDIISIFATIYSLFLVCKICYSLIRRTKKVYTFNISDCLFVLSTMKYMTIGFNVYVGLVLIIFKFFEMHMYLRNVENPSENISLNDKIY